MASMFICNYDTVVEPYLKTISWNFIQMLDYYDRHGNTFVLVSNQEHMKVQRDCSMIPHRYLISSREKEQLYTYEGVFRGTFNDRIDVIDKLSYEPKLFIDKKEIYTLGSSDEDFSMIKKYNGYTLDSASTKLKENSLGIVDGIEEMLQLIKIKKNKKKIGVDVICL